jgi:two-component system chemotaxis response regulator CheY
MRALVIDDSKATREILGDILAELGFEVLKAADGLAGLETLRSAGKVDIVLVDWIMPGMDGYELVLAVREDPALASVRLMMVTTQTEMPKVARALAAGADEYVMKPVTREMIQEKLTCMGISTP